jgi:AcrR family transcriptional regulator
MDSLLSNLKISVNESLYLKDPESTELGRKIIEQSILLIDEMGFDAYTFRKLGERIGSNESSIYRYFENKHKLLLYLSAWYWGWTEYHMVFKTHSILDAKDKLRTAIYMLTRDISIDANFTHVNEEALFRIMISEFSKSYLTKEVDQENKEGYFALYKRIIHRLSEMMREVNPEYPYVQSLASTVVEGALHQHYLSQHFKSITNCDTEFTPTDFYTDMVFRTLKANSDEE